MYHVQCTNDILIGTWYMVIRTSNDSPDHLKLMGILMQVVMKDSLLVDEVVAHPA